MNYTKISNGLKKYLVFTLFFAVALLLKVNQIQAGTFPAGSLLVQANLKSATVYYIGDDGKKYIFPDAKTYFTWYDDFEDVKEVSVVELDQYPDGGIVPYRSGIRLITHQNTGKVYAVEPGGVIRWIKDEETAQNLYGEDWNLLVQDVLPGFFSATYTLGNDMEDRLPTGTVVQEEGSTDYYYIENNLKRKVSNLSVLNLNNINLSHIIQVPDLSTYQSGPEVSYKEAELTECHYKYKYIVDEDEEEDEEDVEEEEDDNDDNQYNQSADIDLTLSKSTAYIYPYFEDSILIDVVLYDETGACVPYTEIYAYATEQEQIEDKAKTAGGSYCGRALFVYRPTRAGEHVINFSAVGIEKEIIVNVVEHTEGFVQVKQTSDKKEDLFPESQGLRMGDIVFSNIIPFDVDVSLDSVMLNVTSTGFQGDFMINANTYYGLVDYVVCTAGFCEASFDLNNYQLSQDEIYDVYFTIDTPELSEDASLCLEYAGGEYSTDAGPVLETVFESSFECSTSTITEE